MNWFNNAPIRVKLISIMTLTAMLALLLATAAVVINEYFTKKNDTEKQLVLIADIIAWNGSASLSFHDVQTGQEMLNGMVSQPSLVSAHLYDNTGALFAVYQSPKGKSSSWTGETIKSLVTVAKNSTQAQNLIQSLTTQLNSWYGRLFKVAAENAPAPIYRQALIYDDNKVLHLFRPILLDGELQGILHLADDQSGLQALLNRFYLIISLIFVFTGLSIVFVSTKLQRVFLAPLLELMQAMRTVSDEKNFTRRISQIGADEFGEMAMVYNTMLTEIQQRDEQLEQHRTHLEQQVVARTQELSEKNRSLQIAIQDALKAKEQAEAASKAKSQFLATMSHEIRTPMNGVLGMTELLMGTGLSERQSRLADTAYRSAKSLLGIINNILDFSKIEAGKLQLLVNEFDVRQLLEETTEMLADQAYRKGVELILNIPANFYCVAQGDSERLRQVLVNLLGNAIKFTDRGEVQLRLSAFTNNQSPGLIDLLFEILDTGPGIASEQQEHIFESFTQQDGSITRRFGGTGLGLTISRQLVELMGSRLRLNSSLGQGSCFYFNLTLPQGLESVVPKADIKEMQGINILVVDDNATNLEIFHNQLSQWGAQVTCVDNGPRALKLLHDAGSQQVHYRIAILDWHMPYMDGLSLAKAIQADPLIAKPSLIMLSSESVTFDGAHCNQYGISLYLNKPVFQHKLLTCLLELLAQKPDTAITPQVLATPKRLSYSGHILLAEDNQINQEVAKGFLEKIGCRTQLANNGQEAVDAAMTKDYDLILMDCHMPVLDGFAATAHIRAHERATQKVRTPIIALTADVQKGIQEQCHNAGMDGYLSKPFSRDQLQQLLATWLQDSNKTCSGNANVGSQYARENLSPAVLDASILEELKSITDDNGQSLLEKAIKLYLETAPDSAEKIRLAASNRQAEELSKLAHSLKSASANLGAKALAADCLALETAGRNHDLTLLDQQLIAFDSHFCQALIALRHELENSDVINTNLTELPMADDEISGAQIMVVDDDPNFRLITSVNLKAAGFTLFEAHSGNDALNKIKIQQPDLIVLDAIMDDLDGFETCKALRDDSKLTDIPIIMSTGLGDIESINRAFSVGASDFVIKPLNYTILIHHIRFLLRSSHNTAELRNSKLQLSAAQRIARMGYWTWQVEQNKFHMSGYLAELCHVDPDTFAGSLEHFIALISPEDRTKVEETIYSTLEGVPTTSIEYCLLTNNADAIIVRQETALISGGANKVVNGTVQDVSRQKETERMIHQLAYYDDLTGLASRSLYQERIEQIIKLARRNQKQFAFLYLDLDEFKYVNDSFGHNVGDQFLKAVTQRIKFVIRDVDFAARLGGDEFCILIDDISNEYQAIEVAERCLHEINRPLILGGNQLKPRVSIGIAIYPKDGDNEHDLLKAADSAMYSAKNAGKQRYAYYRPEMTALAMKRLQDEQLLREAVEKNQFVLYYQPQVDLLSGRVNGLEALLRWQHPVRGLVSPFEFINLAESLGLIQKIGDWVIQNSCLKMMQWHREGMPLLQMAVNISPLHFRDPQLLDSVQNTLELTHMPARYLELEVTESVMQTKGDLKIFAHIKKLGVKIAIDDFGTGYSSLSSLKELPLDCLKIDRSFVQDLLYNSQTPVLLGTIISLSNAMGYKLVAEGVETIDQVLVMSGLGCQTIQGYYFSKPVPADEVPALVKKDFKLYSAVANRLL